jgi:DNA-binding response OmpR family regulator
MDTRVIVIAEDNEAIAHLIQEALNDVPGYGAVTVANGALALEVISAVHANLVISDIDLTGIDGFELYDLLQRRPETARILVIFMSAARHEEELERRGVYDYVLKPFDLDDLLTRVHTLFGRPIVHDEPPGKVVSPD